MAVVPLTRRVLALLLASTLSLSCSGEPADGGDSTAGAGTPAASGSADQARPREQGREGGTLPETPSVEDLPALAAQLDVVSATLRDPGSTRSLLREAGELQQLAVRALNLASARDRRRVLGMVRPATGTVLRANLSAAAPLRDLTAAQRRLPRWRIVRPPAPEVLLGFYRRAERRTDVPWEYLAAIHLTETRMGRIRGTSTAGAQGPMQFIPTTWDIYGAGGDIDDPRDAILAAGRLLRANGAPRRMAQALYRYNPSDSYVRAVSAYARSIRQVPWAYTGYWQWRVFYRHVRGTYVLPVGYPATRPTLLPGE